MIDLCLKKCSLFSLRYAVMSMVWEFHNNQRLSDSSTCTLLFGIHYLRGNPLTIITHLTRWNLAIKNWGNLYQETNLQWRSTREIALPGCKGPWNGNGDSSPFFEVPSIIDSRLTQFPGVPFTSFACWRWEASFLHQKPRHAGIMWILQENRGSAAELAGAAYV